MVSPHHWSLERSPTLEGRVTLSVSVRGVRVHDIVVCVWGWRGDPDCMCVILEEHTRRSIS